MADPQWANWQLGPGSILGAEARNSPFTFTRWGFIFLGASEDCG